MIGLQILLICLGIAVLAAIPVSYGLIGANIRSKTEIQRSAARLSLRLDRIEANLADLAQIPRIRPEIDPNPSNPTPGTEISHFEAPDTPYDPMDGRIPFVDMTWSPDDSHEPETVLDPGGNDV